jgi:hypothetical protein
MFSNVSTIFAVGGEASDPTLAVLALIVSAISLGVTAYNSFAQRRHSAALDVSKTILEDKINQLNKFYGPLQAALRRLFYMKDTVLVALGRPRIADYKNRDEEPPLLHLVDEIKNNPSASKIANELIATQQMIQNDILGQAGYVRNANLREKIQELQRHFQEFQIAFANPQIAKVMQQFPHKMDTDLADEIQSIVAFIDRQTKRAEAYLEQHWADTT